MLNQEGEREVQVLVKQKQKMLDPEGEGEGPIQVKQEQEMLEEVEQ